MNNFVQTKHSSQINLDDVEVQPKITHKQSGCVFFLDIQTFGKSVNPKIFTSPFPITVHRLQITFVKKLFVVSIFFCNFALHNAKANNHVHR